MGSCLSAPSRGSGDDIELRPQAPPPQTARASIPVTQTSSTPRNEPSLSVSQSSTRPRRRSRLSLSIRRSTASRMNLQVLRQYATLASPASSLPANVLLLSNRSTVAIFDAYPKAKYHFLVLPRYPFPAVGESGGSGSRSAVKLEALQDLKSLLTKADPRARDQVLEALEQTAVEVEEMIKDEMNKTEGFEWGVDIGFHAIPSLPHLHLHIISSDRMSPALKSKKHYNSFRPDLGFFIPLAEVRRWVQMEPDTLDQQIQALTDADTLLRTQLECTTCDAAFDNIPQIKAHLEKEFERQKRTALARQARRRDGEESGSS